MNEALFKGQELLTFKVNKFHRFEQLTILRSKLDFIHWPGFGGTQTKTKSWHSHGLKRVGFYIHRQNLLY